MPKMQAISRYPSQYGELMSRAAMQAESITIPCENASKAATLRGRLYAFRRACELSPNEARAMGIDAPSLGLVLIQIQGDNLILSNRNHCQEASLLDSVLAGLPKVSTPASTGNPADVPDPAKFMQNLQGEKYK